MSRHQNELKLEHDVITEVQLIKWFCLICFWLMVINFVSISNVSTSVIGCHWDRKGILVGPTEKNKNKKKNPEKLTTCVEPNCSLQGISFCIKSITGKFVCRFPIYGSPNEHV